MNIAILGAGSVGLAFANLLQTNGHQVKLGSRDSEKFKQKLLASLPHHSFAFTICGLDSALKSARLVLLAVPDDSIQDVCSAIADQLEPNSIVAHLSGALDSSVLSAARELGMQCCSLHPLNSFPNLESSVTLLQAGHGSYLYCEGPTQALKLTDQLFEQCGFVPVRIEASAKPLYHAAGVFACNYLSVLMDASLQAGANAGLDKQTLWRALLPLIQTTLNNIGEQGPAESLSGPIARGDSTTVTKHRQALAEVSPSLAELYTALGNYAIELVEQQGWHDQADIEKLVKTLK